jgi:hypothetical protein
MDKAIEPFLHDHAATLLSGALQYPVKLEWQTKKKNAIKRNSFKVLLIEIKYVYIRHK